jgi:hypothetical protein
MKRTVVGLILAAIVLLACNKNKDNHVVTPEPPSITGTWSVDTVTVNFYDAAGVFDSSIIGYPIAGLNEPLYFQFNEDSSWSESLVDHSDTTVVTEGIYSYTSANSFTLVYPNATPTRKNEPCDILSLTRSSFVFSKQRPTVFNGTFPGNIKYVFKLKK